MWFCSIHTDISKQIWTFFNISKQKELIYNNIGQKYVLTESRQDFWTLNDLIEKAEQYEAYEREQNSIVLKDSAPQVSYLK